MGGHGPVGLNLVAVGYAFDNFYEEVTPKHYFFQQLKILVNASIARMNEIANKDT